MIEWNVDHPDGFGKDGAKDEFICLVTSHGIKAADRHLKEVGDLSPEAASFIKNEETFNGKIEQQFVPCDGCRKLCLDCRMKPGPENIGTPVVKALNTSCGHYH